jgi:hypothetical protein
VNQTRPHCVNQMGKAHSKPLAAQHGRGTAWERRAMCESALMWPLAPHPIIPRVDMLAVDDKILDLSWPTD